MTPDTLHGRQLSLHCATYDNFDASSCLWELIVPNSALLEAPSASMCMCGDGELWGCQVLHRVLTSPVAAVVDAPFCLSPQMAREGAPVRKHLEQDSAIVRREPFDSVVLLMGSPTACGSYRVCGGYIAGPGRENDIRLVSSVGSWGSRSEFPPTLCTKGPAIKGAELTETAP